MSRDSLEALREMLAFIAARSNTYRLPVDPLSFAMPIGVLIDRKEWEPIARAAMTSVFPCDARWVRGEAQS